jgi:hypothetical protein
VKGEIVIVIGPPGEDQAPDGTVLDQACARRMAALGQRCSVEVAALWPQTPRRLCRALELKRESSS